MWPTFALWSDYGTPARRRRISAPGRGGRTRKLFVTAAVVIAGVIGIRGIYRQAIDRTAMPSAAGVHVQSASSPTAKTFARRSIRVAAVPLSPQPVPKDQPAVVSPTPSPASELAPHDTSAAVTAVMPGDHPKPPALTDFPGVLAKASAPPPPFAAATPADKPRSIGARLGGVTHRPRHDGEALVRYAESIAKGHRKELRAVLRLFL